ncbi:tumor necrosis factor receptor superfamily member 16-like [Mya arenaria]|uniref:tumor necrosis factor receptor superfamily member 16-like n=1 Tax=Mya arenaria TaxID=6604 RepID=UPI0022E1D9AB|nr:tumor necrosis factor receptor superfamily member 16-like [Mya arenaria]
MWLSMKVSITCGLFVMVSTIGSLAQVNDTYYYSIEVNLEIIHCKMCKPGTYWIKHCTQDGGEAICEDCDDGRFTENYNRAIYCKRCTECTGTDQPSGEAVAEACTRLHDTICECKSGYWREGNVGACQKVLPCEPGYGVMKLGDSHNDTTCERCVNGKTFSNISSKVTPCQNCSLCLEGWVQKTPCNEFEDTVCIPKAGSHKSTTVYGNTFSDISTDQNQNPEDLKNASVYVIVGVGCGVIFMILGVIIVCYRRKNKLQQSPCWGSNSHGEEEDSQQHPSTSCEMDLLNAGENPHDVEKPNNTSPALLNESSTKKKSL